MGQVRSSAIFDPTNLWTGSSFDPKNLWTGSSTILLIWRTPMLVLLELEGFMLTRCVGKYLSDFYDIILKTNLT